jgi:hypothetical protein
VKEHAWLKFYPWKDLYEKKIEAPFIPKIGDNFDAKYCNAPEKIGNDTKEKYEIYLRDDSYKYAFRNFTYYNEELHEELAKKNNNRNNSSYTKDMKFVNPHMNITNYNFTPAIQKENTITPSILSSRGSQVNPASSKEPTSLLLEKMKLANDKNPSNNIENKFLKLKKQSNSSSTASLLRQYRQSNVSLNSTNTSINYLHKRSGSTSNLNY